VWHFQPDIVLLAFTCNDVRNNSKLLEWDRMRPFYDLVDDRLVLDDSFRQSDAYRFRRSAWMQSFYAAVNASRVLQLLREGRNSWTRRRLMAQQAKSTTGTGQDGTRGVFGEPQDADWKKAWAITEQILLRIRDDVVKRDVMFLLAIT